MNFRRLTYVAYTVMALVLSIYWTEGSSHAGDLKSSSVPNLEGTWNLSFEEMCLPKGYASATETMVVTNQIGRVFEGYFDDPIEPSLVYFTGAIVGRTVRITNAGYSEGTVDDMAILTGMLVNSYMIVGTFTQWEKYEYNGFCTGVFKAVKEVVQ